MNWVCCSLWCWDLNLNFLFSVYGISWNQIFGGKNIFFTLGDENATVPVWFDNHFGASSGTTTSTSSWTASTTSSTASAASTAATSTSWCKAHWHQLSVRQSK